MLRLRKQSCSRAIRRKASRRRSGARQRPRSTASSRSRWCTSIQVTLALADHHRCARTNQRAAALIGMTKASQRRVLQLADERPCHQTSVRRSRSSRPITKRAARQSIAGQATTLSSLIHRRHFRSRANETSRYQAANLRKCTGSFHLQPCSQRPSLTATSHYPSRVSSFSSSLLITSHSPNSWTLSKC